PRPDEGEQAQPEPGSRFEPGGLPRHYFNLDKPFACIHANPSARKASSASRVPGVLQEAESSSSRRSRSRERFETQLMESEGNGEDRFREAAERAREELMRQLGGEAERLDRELSDLSEQMTSSAARVAEERVER